MPFPPLLRLSRVEQVHIVLSHKYCVALLAFLASVDLVEIVGVLCYQLFTAAYFPWHLYPMMLNRAIELIALVCSRAQIPSMYSSSQVVLSLLSLIVYARRQPCSKYSCAAPLVLYSILLSYEVFVAVMVAKVSKMPMADDHGHIIANWPTSAASTNAATATADPVVIGLSPRTPSTAATGTTTELIAVQQPDGNKLAIARPIDVARGL